MFIVTYVTNGITSNEKLQNDTKRWYCPKCSKELLFSDVRDKDLHKAIHVQPTPQTYFINVPNKKSKGLFFTSPGYNIEQTPTESSAGGTLIYVSQNLSYKRRTDLKICSPKKLESVFI